MHQSCEGEFTYNFGVFLYSFQESIVNPLNDLQFYQFHQLLQTHFTILNTFVCKCFMFKESSLAKSSELKLVFIRLPLTLSFLHSKVSIISLTFSSFLICTSLVDSTVLCEGGESSFCLHLFGIHLIHFGSILHEL